MSAATTIEKPENPDDKKKEIPFTFSVPKTSDDLEELFSGRGPKEKAIIVERMIKCNHPQFGKDNKAQLENLFAFLLQHIHDCASIGKVLTHCKLCKTYFFSFNSFHIRIPFCYRLTFEM